MDDEEFEKLKRENTVDNSGLEEIMGEEITPQMQDEFFKELKDSRLFMPVDFGLDAFKGIENSKPGDVIEGPSGFSIRFLTDGDGNKAVPLFTSEGMMEKAGVKSSVMVIYMSDLADMLKQTSDYSLIAINPFTEFDLNMPVGAFIGLFDDSAERQKALLESLNDMLEILKKHSVELEENTTLFIRDDENFMIDNAVDGVFTARAPFSVSSNPKYGEGLKYTNILLMPKSKRILPLGVDNELDVIIAPGTEFKLEDTMDGTQNLWMCGEQPFYDE